MVILTHAVATDTESIYIDGDYQCNGEKGELWTEDYILPMIDKYNVDTVRRISYLGVTTPPENVSDFFETGQYEQVEEIELEAPYF